MLGHLPVAAARRPSVPQRVHALRDAGWDPEVKKVYGLGPLPSVLNPGRAKVRELTGRQWVPVLVTDDGQVIEDSSSIVAWAKANPASGAEATPA